MEHFNKLNISRLWKEEIYNNKSAELVVWTNQAPLYDTKN